MSYPVASVTPVEDTDERTPLISSSKEIYDDDEKHDHVLSAEDTPAYVVLQEYDLLVTKYRKENFEDIFTNKDLDANSSNSDTLCKRWQWGVYWTPCVGLIVYNMFNTEVIVPPGYVCPFTDNDNNYIFAKPGVHNWTSLFLKKDRDPVDVADPSLYVSHGNRTVVTVVQGELGYAEDKGQPILLPPGLHSWDSETLKYKETIALDDNVIKFGPYTLLTVDEGYSAITQNNGVQEILGGGKTHLLTHKKWVFEKFITQKIQTDELEQIRAASADNVIMSVTSTVVWKINDVHTAATMAAETMHTKSYDSNPANADITKLRKDVLKQAIASLAGFIGSVNYSDSFHVAAAAQRNMETATVVGVVDEGGEATNPARSGDNPMFDNDRMSDSVSHANQITSKYGVEILSINIISANPVDEKLTASLATGAVASAQALQAETQARGNAKARKIEADSAAITRKVDAQSEAEATLVRAKAEGQAEVLKAQGTKEAEILRAEGVKKAAELIQSSEVAVDLEKIKASSEAIRNSDKFFFGQEPAFMSNMLMKGPSV